MIEEIEDMRNSGRPCLVGTTSVEISELLSRMLNLRRIPHYVLNAKLHQQEANIVAEAGKSTMGRVWTTSDGRAFSDKATAMKYKEIIDQENAGSKKKKNAAPIAETSITIEGVRIVVDSGYYRQLVYDPASGLSHLETVRTSKDMAKQRAGRAGRVAPGTCYQLWTAATELRMSEQRQPEIVNADLTPVVLDIAALGETSVKTLPWLTPPADLDVIKASRQLQLLHAITAGGHITPPTSSSR